MSTAAETLRPRESVTRCEKLRTVVRLFHFPAGLLKFRFPRLPDRRDAGACDGPEAAISTAFVRPLFALSGYQRTGQAGGAGRYWAVLNLYLQNFHGWSTADDVPRVAYSSCTVATYVQALYINNSLIP